MSLSCNAGIETPNRQRNVDYLSLEKDGLDCSHSNIQYSQGFSLDCQHGQQRLWRATKDGPAGSLDGISAGSRGNCTFLTSAALQDTVCVLCQLLRITGTCWTVTCCPQRTAGTGSHHNFVSLPLNRLPICVFVQGGRSDSPRIRPLLGSSCD